MTTSKSNEKNDNKPEQGMPILTGAEVLPENAVPATLAVIKYAYRYTTGPFLLPQNSGSLDWVILNNDTTRQTVQVTVFKCAIGAVKTAAAPGALVISLDPGMTTHNANTYTAGFIYEIQVECNSQLIFPYVSVWPANFGVIIPGTGINSGTFVRVMP